MQKSQLPPRPLVPRLFSLDRATDVTLLTNLRRSLIRIDWLWESFVWLETLGSRGKMERLPSGRPQTKESTNCWRGEPRLRLQKWRCPYIRLARPLLKLMPELRFSALIMTIPGKDGYLRT